MPDPEDGLTAAIGRAERQQVSVGALLLGSGPRFARDAVGPVLGFYVGWRLGGLATGIAVATGITVAAFLWERRHGRAGLVAGIGLVIALGQALVGLLSGSVKWYLAPPVIINAAYGLAFLGSVLIRRPLAGALATETYPFPPQVQASSTFIHTFSHVSIVWAVYLLGRSALRLVILIRGTVEGFIAVNILTGFPFTAAIMAWSVWYGVRAFRRSEEFGRYLTPEGEGSGLVR